MAGSRLRKLPSRMALSASRRRRSWAGSVPLSSAGAGRREAAPDGAPLRLRGAGHRVSLGPGPCAVAGKSVTMSESRPIPSPGTSCHLCRSARDAVSSRTRVRSRRHADSPVLQLDEWGAPELAGQRGARRERARDERSGPYRYHRHGRPAGSTRTACGSRSRTSTRAGRCPPGCAPATTSPRAAAACSSPRPSPRRGASSTRPPTKRVWLVCDRHRPATSRPGARADAALDHGRGRRRRRRRARARRHRLGLERRRHPSLRLAAGADRGPPLPPDRRPGRRPASARPRRLRRTACGRASTRCSPGTVPRCRVFASHRAVAPDGSAALLHGPGGPADAARAPGGPAAARAVRRESDPLGLRDDSLLRLAVDDYLPARHGAGARRARRRRVVPPDRPRGRRRVRGGRGQRAARRRPRHPHRGRRRRAPPTRAARTCRS